MNLGSFFFLRSTSGTLTVTSKNNTYRGADLTTKGGVFYIYAEKPVTFSDVNSTFQCKNKI